MTKRAETAPAAQDILDINETGLAPCSEASPSARSQVAAL
jgi:hypothetical protein